MYTSPLPPGIAIINDDPGHDFPVPPPGMSRGLQLPPEEERDYSGSALPFPQELLIPRSEWQARIQEMDERKTWITDLTDQVGLKVKDQDGTNYCWINAPVHCIEICRVMQNQPMISLSPASCGAPIKGFRNNGGWGKEGLQYIANYGVVPSANWPDNAINRQYYTEENKALALSYRALEWWVLRPRNLEEQVSVILQGFAVAVGLNYWSHEVTDVRVAWVDGEPAIIFDNSWGMDYGANGRGMRQGSKRLADDAVVCCSTMAS